ncbi:MAG: preprotein translocase subunit SecD [Patescibacteria group bacterium]|nr:preprotein translocase subunit SecD [Patescibacteria group bacterium]
MNKYSYPQQHKLVNKNKVRWTAVFIGVLSMLAVMFIVPNVSFLAQDHWVNKVRMHLGLDLQGGTHLVYQADVSALDSAERRDRVEALRDVIERRVNAYGVSEPLVQTNISGENYRIIVELAGVTDVNEAIKIIDKTPVLDFKTEGAAPAPVDNDVVRQKADEVLQRALKKEDFAKLAKEFSEDPGSKDLGGDLGWVKAGDFVPEFDRAIFEDLKSGEISKQLVESQFGYHIIKKIEERTTEGVKEVHSAHILFAKQNADLNVTWVDTKLSGKNIKKAQLQFDATTQEPMVLLDFDEEGTETFANLTELNVGKTIGIFLDGALRSNPVVQEPIRDGSAQISGQFTIDEAKQLVKDLNLGALPVPITLLTQQTIGPSLGQISLDQSLLAGIIGFLSAALFMLIFYRLPGLLAVIALGVYTALSLAIFELVPVTMTMAGIAGFILSIGMAVDANILIFERTKEELYNGKNLSSAVEDGFERAWPSIRDSNFSSIITCVILAWFGTSIVKGFAITLGIGILVSMFSALTVTHTLMRLVVNKKLENKLGLFGVSLEKTEEK